MALQLQTPYIGRGRTPLSIGWLAGVSIAAILALFANGEQGVWFDPSDLSTQFQDPSGTIPVTGAGQPIGLVLDKRLWGGKTLAQVIANQSELKSNGSVSTIGSPVPTATYDTATGQGTISRVDASNNSGVLLPGTVGKWYAIDIQGTSGFDFGIRTAGLTGSVLAPIVSGATRSTRILQLSSGAGFYLAANGDGRSSAFTLYSFKEIPGNHASQSTVASKPTLVSVPDPVFMAGQPEQVPHPIDLTGPNYLSAGGGVIITADTITTPTLGTGVLYEGFKNNKLRQVIVKYEALTSGGSFSVCDVNAATVLSNSTSASGTFTLTYTPKVDANQGRIYLRLGVANTSVKIVDISVKEVPANAPYIWAWAFDGVDDFLITNSIDFSSNDEITLLTGLAKTRDLTGVPVETSTNSSLSVGAFGVYAPGMDNQPNLAFVSRGATNAAMAMYTGPETAAGLLLVTTGLRKIATNVNRLRVNGSQLASDASVQGAASNIVSPLYIGRRGGSTYPFSGNIYGLVVRGAMTADPQLTNAEKFMAKKTGVAI